MQRYGYIDRLRTRATKRVMRCRVRRSGLAQIQCRHGHPVPLHHGWRRLMAMHLLAGCLRCSQWDPSAVVAGGLDDYSLERSDMPARQGASAARAVRNSV